MPELMSETRRLSKANGHQSATSGVAAVSSQREAASPGEALVGASTGAIMAKL